MELNQKIDFDSHPVWILLGQIEYCQRIADDLVSEIRSKIYFNDIRNFELSYSSLSDFFDFIGLHSMILKIGICTIKKNDDNLITAILKKIEDIPDGVKLIIIANSLPQVLLNRGMVWKFKEKGNVFREQKWLEEVLLKEMHFKSKKIVALYYKTWHKLLEVRSWLTGNQITESNAIEMMKSIIEVACIQEKIENS